MVCLAKPVLKTSLSALNNLRGDSIEILNNRSVKTTKYGYTTILAKEFENPNLRVLFGRSETNSRQTMTDMCLLRRVKMMSQKNLTEKVNPIDV